MRVITSVGGVLRTLSSSFEEGAASGRRTLHTGLEAIDSSLPGGAFVCGAVHEVLSGTEMPSCLLPILLTRAAAPLGRVVWCDSLRSFYPPAAAAMGLPLDQLIVLRRRV